MALERLRLDGQVAIVTGMGRGVGRGVANVLSEAGAAIVGSARTASEVEASAAAIRATGGKAVAVPGDVTKLEDNARLVQAALDEFGRIDIVINNAGGGGGFKPLMQVDEDEFRRVFDLNATSAFMITKLAMPHLLKSGRGSVVNISSGAGRFGVRGLTPYSVAKGGLDQLTRAMAQEFAPKVRVNAIALGSVLTDALRRNFEAIPGLEARMAGMVPLHRMGDVEDIGLCALYLCSQGCYATGAVFQVDGGIQGPTMGSELPDL